MSNKATQFQPGQSGNPAGQPKKDNSWRAIYEEAFNEIVENNCNDKILEIAKQLKVEKKTWKEAVAKVVRYKALNGDINFINNAQNRMEGQPKQSVEQIGNINIKYEDESDKNI